VGGACESKRAEDAVGIGHGEISIAREQTIRATHRRFPSTMFRDRSALAAIAGALSVIPNKQLS
jgi:hypothetical protein